MNHPDAAMFTVVLAGATDSEIIHDIVALEAELRAAQLAGDIAALDRLLADELLFTGPDGRIAGKADDLEAHRSGAVRFREHVPEELRIRRVGADVAITALRARIVVEVGGATVRDTVRYTRVWAREAGGRWRIVGGQVAAIPGPSVESGRSPLAAARALHAALEAGQHGEALRPLFTEDAFTIEHPNRIKPEGARTSLEAMLAGSSAGAALLAKQTYDVHSAIEHGTNAILRLTWTGVIGRTVGAFREGQVLTAHIAQFVEVRDGRIASIETYDCYGPLPT